MTPDAIKYRITLENEERLRTRTWQPGDDDVQDGVVPARPARWWDVAVTPTSRLIVWMLPGSNRRWAQPIGTVLVAAYFAVAYALWHWTPPSDAMALLAVPGIVLSLWNALKFAVVVVWTVARQLRDPL